VQCIVDRVMMKAWKWCFLQDKEKGESYYKHKKRAFVFPFAVKLCQPVQTRRGLEIEAAEVTPRFSLPPNNDATGRREPVVIAVPLQHQNPRSQALDAKLCYLCKGPPKQQEHAYCV
jgi:hypothetical protein